MHWLKDPFVLLLILGGILYSALTILRPAAPDDNQIIVDQAHLLFFIQERSKAFEPQAAQALLDEMPPEDIQQLIRQYVEEETLYRKARALGLDESDYVMRLRMVQKYEFLLESTLDEIAAGDDVLQVYFRKNRENYQEAALVSFEHMFFADKPGQNARQSAQTALDTVKRGGRTGNNAGDLFPYQKNYSLRPEPLVRSHFGGGFARAVFAGEYPKGQWFGPVQSDYGWHLVRIFHRRSTADPDFADIKDRVRNDYKRERKQEQMHALVNGLTAEYDVRIADDIKARIDKAP